MHCRARKKRVFSLCLGVVVVLFWFTTYALDDGKDISVSNVIIIGATGDLAKKYLWQGFFNLFVDLHTSSHHVNLIGASRVEYSEGSRQLTGILQDHVHCPDGLSDCSQLRKEFKQQVSYAQLKTQEDYAELCRKLNEQTTAKGMIEKGRLIYLSVPPFAYAEIVANINSVCRPPTSATWLKVVLEKPFGSDLRSAQTLAAEISKHLKEEEIYRIDHYLGKPGVRNILPFRISNRDILEPVWNHKHIEYVEIALKETLDVKGRISFYDKYGVIRDVMQNHLTEIMSLVAMEIPKDLNAVADRKLQLLRDVLPVRASQTVIGQYDDYHKDWMTELSQNPGNKSYTPTFGASALFINNHRWKGVPFVLLSGKKLQEKLSYVKIVFRNVAICPTSVSWLEDKLCEPRQIIFILSQSGSQFPEILVSENFPRPNLPENTFEAEVEEGKEFSVFGKHVSKYFIYSGMPGDAYTTLIRDCYHGNKANFVSTDSLIASWKIWDSVLQELHRTEPRIYRTDQSQSGWLNFQVTGHQLQFTVQKTEEEDAFMESSLTSSYFMLDVGSFRKQPLFRGSSETVVEELAKAIYRIALEAVKERGSFHIAFSGGTTPSALFSVLVQDYQEDFPWQKTHIWMVDERCVPRSDVRSNFNSLHNSLLKHIAIPHFNVHPMPTELINGLCSFDDKGPQVYAAEMNRLLPEDRLDFVLLGVGSDGHTASLFPDSAGVNETYHRVIITPDGPADGVRYRMSMTYYTINNARNIGILVLGSDKREIIKVLDNENELSFTKYPILGVIPVNGSLQWYIDELALSD